MPMSKKTYQVAAIGLFVLVLAVVSFVVAPWEYVPRLVAAQQDEDGHAHDEAGHDHDEHEHGEPGEDKGHGHEDEEHGPHDDDEEHAHSEEEHANREDEHDHEDHEHGEDEHGHEDDAHAHEEGLQLTDAEMAEFNITTQQASSGKLNIQASLPGEVRLNADRLAHVVPRLPGIVREVSVTLGDRVSQRQTMAVLESRELATAKAGYLAAREQASLAQSTFERERSLWQDKISAERDYLEAKNAFAEARIAARSAQQELEALGLSADYISKLTQESGASLTRFEVTAPLDGTVITKHIALGEFVEPNAEIFTVADLSSVWIDLSVFQKDLSSIREGQKVLIASDTALPDATGTIAYVGPIVGEETRTALARIVLPNESGVWRPGMFVTGRVAVSEVPIAVVVPKTALLTIDGQTKVFVQDDHGFEPVTVKLGRADRTHAEILDGLSENQTYVATGGFHLKAEMEKEAFAHSGHAH